MGAASAAYAQQQALDPISQALQQRAAEWSDGFDATAAETPNVRTAVPIFSPETLSASQLAVQRYTDIVLRGGWPQVPTNIQLKLGSRDPAVVLIRQRLIASGDLNGATGMSDTFDSYVDQAVRRFQLRHAMPADGTVGPTTIASMNVPADVRLAQLSKNVERLRPYATKPLDRFVMVNIPGAAVEAVQSGRIASRHNAVVGRIDRPSPEVHSKISEINFNPYWTVPASIIRKDLIPLVRSNPGYLADQHIHIYDRKGGEVFKEQIDWNSDQAVNYLFRQDPGEWNSMGSVKINFASPEGVYMHDTPNKGLFNDDFRFDSSGCVRIQNVRALIVWILRDTPGWGRDQVDGMFRASQRLDVRVVNAIPLHWVYITGWASGDGVVHFRDDIYLRDGVGEIAMSHPAAVAAQTAAAIAHPVSADEDALPGTGQPAPAGGGYGQPAGYGQQGGGYGQGGYGPATTGSTSPAPRGGPIPLVDVGGR